MWNRPEVVEDPVYNRNVISIAFGGYIIFNTLVKGAERAIFGVMGERLSYNIRLEILTAILYKQIS